MKRNCESLVASQNIRPGASGAELGRKGKGGGGQQIGTKEWDPVGLREH